MLPIFDTFTKWNVSSSLSFLEQSQWWSRDQIISFQNKALHLIIEHSYNTVPYYREIMDANGVIPDDFKSIEDLSKFPVTTKDDIIKHFQSRKLLSNIARPGSYFLNQSSGSTGKRTRFFISKKAYGFNMAANLRGWQWMGYCFGDRLIKVSQNERHSFVKKAQDYINSTILFSSSYSEKSLLEFIKTMNAYNPSFLRSYPDPLYFLASLISKQNISIPAIKAINTTGNILFPETRDVIEKVFICKIFDSYSCEGGPNVFECPSHENYHVSDEYGVLEIINDRGQNALPGEKGRVYVTDFHNFAFPFIRYDSMDIAIRGDNCSCGRKLSTVKQIIGRDNDILVTRNGQYLVGQTFTTYFKLVPWIDTFRVVQDTPTNINIEIVVNSNPEQYMLEDIRKYWLAYTDNSMEIEVAVVASIELLPSGKRKFLYRNPSIELPL